MPKLDFQAERWAQRINRLHLIYLGLLPSLATFIVLRTHGYRWMFPLFIGGVAMVGVLLAEIFAHTRLPDSLPASLLVLLDGPMIALLATHGRGFAFAIDSFLVEGLAVWLAIAVLAVVSDLPTPWQRNASVVIMLIAVGLSLSLFWPYLRITLEERWFKLVWLAIGVIEGAIVRFRLLRTEEIVPRDADFQILYIALLTMAWVAAMILGKVWYDMEL